MNVRARIAGETTLGIAALVIAGTLAAGHADAQPARADRYAVEVGDDNADGVITEDETGWDCATMGNHICGAGSPSAK